ncbi:hypothetical protein LLH06_16610 [Mucilaginibacter daejeonensis]|uniref:outer membrane beta-barrel protein n=1 Tax=Mucilaginibacter daejeonensis TaxID=398049 RepID=UPI001D17B150|nr:outer membrane beta-barrel protein [Mucilaginibacter daejeonensis]UEG52579.1 hypothetical protein LLH06_16610 [Mucilaginibacter daejeonensis]
MASSCFGRSFSWVIVVCLVVVAAVCPQVTNAQDILHRSVNDRLTISISGGYAQLNTSWSIAGNVKGQKPNILSELKWTGLKGPVLDVGLRYQFTDHWFVSGKFINTLFRGGTVTDTDYSGDDRTGEAFRIELPVQKGNDKVYDLMLGYRISLADRWRMDISAGYNDYRQHLYLTDPVNRTDLNSTYQNSWRGASVLVAPAFQASSRLTLHGTVKYDQIRYDAVGNWDQVNEFAHPISFRHRANGYGFTVGAGVMYELNRNLSIDLRGYGFKRETGNGTDKLYLANGNESITQFNGARSTGYQLLLGLIVKL